MKKLLVAAVAFATLAVVPSAAQASIGGGQLTLKKNVAKAGVVIDGLGAISCGLDCSEAYAYYEDECDGEGFCWPQFAELEAQPQTGWKVTWDNCIAWEENYCSVNMKDDETVTVNFQDVADPTVAISGPVDGAPVRGTIAVGATAGDNNAVDRVELYVDGAHVASTGQAPYGFQLNTAQFGDGNHTVAVRSVDVVGRASGLSQRNVLIDNSNPEVQINGGTADGAIVGAPGTAAYEFAASDATSGIAAVQCALDGGSVVACDSPTAHTLSNVAEGPQKFLVRAVDGAGNAGNWVQRSFTVDKTAPTLEITSGPAHGSQVGKPGSVQYAFAASDASGISSLTCATDGVFGDCTSPTGHGASNLGDGAHVFKFRAVDAAGNETVVTRSVDVDTTAPAISFTVAPAPGSVIGTPSAEIAFGISDATGTASVECVLDDVAAACAGPGSHELVDLAHGQHTFAVRATDPAGNTGTASRTFQVDLQAPETKIDTASTGASPAFTFSANEEGSTFKCRLYAASATPPAFGACVGAGGSHSTTGLAAGSYVFEVVATDAAGHTDATPARKEFTVTASQPQNPGGDTGNGNDDGGNGNTGTGANTGTGTNTGTNTGGPSGVEKVDANAGWRWKYDNRGRTHATKLNIRDIPQGATVEILCDAKGCPFKRKSLPYKGAKLKLAPVLKKRNMKAGGTLEIRVVKPDAIAWVLVFKMRPKGEPSYKVLCLPAGAARPAAC